MGEKSLLKARLDRQAEAIKLLSVRLVEIEEKAQRLQKRVRLMEDQYKAAMKRPTALSVPDPTAFTPVPEISEEVESLAKTFEMPERCIHCNGLKEEGRELVLSCTNCAAKWNTLGGKDRYNAFARKECNSCGEKKRRAGIAPMCPACSAAFAAYKKVVKRDNILARNRAYEEGEDVDA